MIRLIIVGEGDHVLDLSPIYIYIYIYIYIHICIYISIYIYTIRCVTVGEGDHVLDAHQLRRDLADDVEQLAVGDDHL